MATISGALRKCTVCGEPLVGEGARCECRFCGSVYAFANPQMEDELQTANAFRECTRFEEAETLYKQILKKYREYDLSEVYWNLFLCEQRVMFETDEKGERFPSFYTITDDEIEDSLYYLGAIGAAEKKAPERVEIFKTLAEKMIRVKQLYTRISDTSKPYDLFICFKKSAFEGGDTKDCALAIDLYNHLAKDYNIFFSERSLKNVVVREFEPNIYYGLYTAKVMLVLCSRKEYVESQWLKNEWSRFHAFAQNPAAGKTIIPIFLEDFSPRSLPNELISYQGLHADYHLFDELGKTLRNILKPVDMEAELNRRMQEMMAQLRGEMAAQAPTPAITPSFVSKPQPAVTPKFQPNPTDDFDIEDGVLKKYKGTASNVIIPSGVTSIGEKAFEKCSDLIKIIIPNSVINIGNFAFSECSKLSDITIPANTTTIGNYAFNHCGSLANINVDSKNDVYHSSQNCLIKTKEKILIQGCKNSIIPSDGSVTNIDDGSFSGCIDLTNIVIPNSVTTIGYCAFSSCNNLTDIKIPDSVTTIYHLAFANCKNLKSITVSNNVKEIGYCAFAGCTSLTEINASFFKKKLIEKQIKEKT